MPCTPVDFEKIIRRVSYANSELTFRNTREKAVDLFRSITSDFCLEKSSEDKITIKAKHNNKTIRVDIQVEKSRINEWWLVTITPHL
jgi:hypothetical protein